MKKPANLRNTLGIVLVVIVVAVCLFAGKVTASIGDESLVVSGMLKKTTIPYSDIVSAECRDKFDAGTRSFGMSLLHVKSGTFTNSEFGGYTLAMNTYTDRVIVLSLADGSHFVFNVDGEDETSALCDEIAARLS